MMTVFEQRTHEYIQEACKGISEITLRDLFAMSALTGTLRGTTYTDEEIKIKAKQSYELADAMLKVRNKR